MKFVVQFKPIISVDFGRFLILRYENFKMFLKSTSRLDLFLDNECISKWSMKTKLLQFSNLKIWDDIFVLQDSFTFI